MEIHVYSSESKKTLLSDCACLYNKDLSVKMKKKKKKKIRLK